MAHPGGRPSIYTQELADEICAALEDSAMSLRKLCEANKHWPDRATIVRWIRHNAQFCAQYDKARESQADFLSDEIVDVAYNDQKDHKVIVDDNGNEKTVVVSEAVNRSRLKVDALKWKAAVLNRKKYGEKQHIEADINAHEVKIKDLG